jgi:hypothetical protein
VAKKTAAARKQSVPAVAQAAADDAEPTLVSRTVEVGSVVPPVAKKRAVPVAAKKQSAPAVAVPCAGDSPVLVGPATPTAPEEAVPKVKRHKAAKPEAKHPKSKDSGPKDQQATKQTAGDDEPRGTNDCAQDTPAKRRKKTANDPQAAVVQAAGTDGGNDGEEPADADGQDTCPTRV